MSTIQTALITGASRGIGAATARLLAQRGYAVAVNYCQSGEQALALVEELTKNGHTAIAIQADVSNLAQVERMIHNVLDEFCQLDILVCNAGIAKSGLLSDFTQDQWHQIFAVNVDGVFHAVRAALPYFIHQKSGRIVTVSSMWGQVGASCEVAYSASKAAIIGLTKALAKELAPSGITVNCVAPGPINTEMNAKYSQQDLAALAEETPLGRLGTPEEVAAAIAFLACEEGSFFTGQVLSPNGGFVI